MIAGHTKFVVDWEFKLVKRKFRHIKVSCLADTALVVDESSYVNTAVLAGDKI